VLAQTLVSGGGYFQGTDLRVADAVAEADGGARFRIVPSTSLAPGNWYTLRLTPSPDYRLVPLSRFGELPVTFFTASAPSVLYLIRPTVPMKTDVSVTFTEPVSVTHAAFFAGTTELAGCLILSDACTEAESSAFTFRFSVTPVQRPSVTRLLVTGRAAGRDFTLDLPISGWSACGSDTECWRPAP
jgi:hypothetical protein